MITALIVDDEKKARENLKILLEEFCEGVTVIGMAENVKDAISIIDDEDPDVVFLDIQMRGETGFDLLEHYKNIGFEVVFTTAHSEFALKAIKFSAVDYLLKPIDIEDLQKSIRKVEGKARMDNQLKGKLEVLLQNLRPDNSSNHKIALPTTNGLVFLKLSEIIYCEGQSNYTVIFTVDNRKFIVSRTLKEYEEMLTDHNFFRIHKSYLINLKEIKEYIRGDGGYVIMNNQKSLGVSKRRKEPFMNKISNMV